MIVFGPNYDNSAEFNTISAQDLTVRQMQGEFNLFGPISGDMIKKLSDPVRRAQINRSAGHNPEFIARKFS